MKIASQYCTLLDIRILLLYITLYGILLLHSYTIITLPLLEDYFMITCSLLLDYFISISYYFIITTIRSILLISTRSLRRLIGSSGIVGVE